MRRRLIQGVLDRLLPEPEGAQWPTLAKVLAQGGAGLRIRAVSASTGCLPLGRGLDLLLDPVPGVRRAAAWALAGTADALADPRVIAAVWAAARAERSDTARLAMAVAAVRLGADVDRAWQLLEQAARRRLASFYGPRSLAMACGAGPDQVSRVWFRTLDPAADHHGDPVRLQPRSGEQLRQRARSLLDQNPEDRSALLDLAVQQHPDDHLRIVGRKWVSGRRESHVISDALGLHGDPRALPVLVAVLRAMDVDPGHGFAGRRAASVAMGRIGDPSVAPILDKALVDEALDYEGRPGAGLGIQFPVRSVILTALGEAGCVDRAALLASYLGNVSGSALGGFYLPAMDALWKLGDTSALVPLLQREELPAANALGVLAALGARSVVESHLGDPRPRVSQAAVDGLGLWTRSSGS